MKNVLASARVVHEYYRLVDSNPEDPNYHLKLSQFQSIASTKFENFYCREDNPIVSLFQTLISMDHSIRDLDNMGLENLANEMHGLQRKVDSNLRAIVSRLLHVDVTNDVPFDLDFVNYVTMPSVNDGSNVTWLVNYRNKQQRSNR